MKNLFFLSNPVISRHRVLSAWVPGDGWGAGLGLTRHSGIMLGMCCRTWQGVSVTVPSCDCPVPRDRGNSPRALSEAGMRVQLQNGAPIPGRPDGGFSFRNCPRKLAGTHPLKLLPSRYSRSRLERWPNSGGISPLNSLKPRCNTLRLERRPNSGGISPLNSLTERYSILRLERRPNSGGISPFNSLTERYSILRLERRPNSGGISPFNPLSQKYKPVRRPLESTVTPCH